MFMRLVKVKVQEGRHGSMQQHYGQRIIPALENVPGCSYAGLMRSVHNSDECLSLTLWDSEEHARAYERSGLFETLLEETRPYLLESSESRLQLSEDLTLQYVPVPADPVVSRHPVALRSDTLSAQQEQRSPMWVRIVSLKLRPGRRAEFERLYRDQVIPTLRGVRGCRYIYLTERTDREDEVLSVTSWERKEDAQAYEESGLFARLLESQSDALSDLYHWKLDEQKKKGALSATSDDPTIEQFDVVAGKAFK